MRNNVATIFLAIGSLLTISTLGYAHHGNAAYATATKVTVSGTVTEFIWANPHCFLKFDAKDDKGEVQHWIVEASNPPDETRRGWTRNSFKPGDSVTVTVIQAKNGSTIGRFSNEPNSVVLNGHPFPATSVNNAQTESKP
jgi:hypothetical protein